MTTAAAGDLYSPDTYVRSMPHDAFAMLRRESPVLWQDEPAGPGYWALLSYDDVVTVSSDNTLFSSARGGTNLEDMPPDALAMIRTLMINMDPPQHTKYRRLVSAGFTPKMVRQLEPGVRETTRRIVGNVAARGSCDFVTEIAAELPLAVIADLIGVPEEDHHRLFEWSNRLIGFDDPEFHTSPEDGQVAATEMFMYAHALASERKLHPKTDLVSVLMGAEVDGERLAEADFDGFFILLSVAGNETTRNLISGAMLALIEHPQQRARLIADPALMPVAVEEFLRWVSPLIYFRRTLQHDAVVGGQQMREGDKVAMYYPSANRDERAFERADAFDVGRSPNAHLAFGGGGPHFCLGASLARLEIRCMFEELLARLPDIELAGPVQRLRSNFINGIKHMPVQFAPRS
ncbi:MAG: cytochrome P450 [Chloroflexota bacterium]|nr:cytochrome P450 [Chloroflexota bacterium]